MLWFFLLTWAVLGAASVVLAFFDWRELRRAGVSHPFHWAWSFLGLINLGFVYVFARAITNRNGSGLIVPAVVSSALLILTTATVAAAAIVIASGTLLFFAITHLGA